MNTDMNVDICTGIATDSSSSSGSGCKANTSGSTSYGFVCSSSSTEESRGIRRVGDTFAIEIKPKQGWLQLPSDVSDLFDLMPATAAAAAREGDETIDPAQLTCDPLMSECKCRCRYCSMQQLKVSATLQNIFACHLTCHSLTQLLSSPLSFPVAAANWQNQTIERLLSIGALFRVS